NFDEFTCSWSTSFSPHLTSWVLRAGSCVRRGEHRRSRGPQRTTSRTRPHTAILMKILADPALTFVPALRRVPRPIGDISSSTAVEVRQPREAPRPLLAYLDPGVLCSIWRGAFAMISVAA